MDNKYLDIEDIIATQNQVACHLQADIPKLGFLNPASGNSDLERGKKIELPFWLAEGLTNSSSAPIVTVEIPKEYSANFREILEADATAVNLCRVNPHYYQFGLHLLKFDSDDRGSIRRAIIETFGKRALWLMNKATQEAVEEAPKELERKEREIYLRAKSLSTDFRKAGLYCGPSSLKRQSERTKRKFKEVL